MEHELGDIASVLSSSLALSSITCGVVQTTSPEATEVEHDLSGETLHAYDEKKREVDDSNETKGGDFVVVTKEDMEQEVVDRFPEPMEKSQEVQMEGSLWTLVGSKEENDPSLKLDIFGLLARQQQTLQRQQEKQLLALVSVYGQAGNREAFSQLQHSLTILQGVSTATNPLLIVDASDPEYSAQRDQLLAISGRGHVYPQFFWVKTSASVVVDDSKDFVKQDQETEEQKAEDDDTGDELSNLRKWNIMEYFPLENVQFFGDYHDLFTANEWGTLNNAIVAQKPLVDQPLMKDEEDLAGNGEIADMEKTTGESMNDHENNNGTTYQPSFVGEGDNLLILDNIVRGEKGSDTVGSSDDFVQEKVPNHVMKEESFSEEMETKEKKVQSSNSLTDREATISNHVMKIEELGPGEEVPKMVAADFAPLMKKTQAEDQKGPANAEQVETVHGMMPSGRVTSPHAIESEGNGEHIEPSIGDSSETNGDHTSKEDSAMKPNSAAEATKKMSAFQMRSGVKKDPTLFGNLEIPEWVDTWMVLPDNPVVNMLESISQRITEHKNIETTADVTLVFRNGEQKTQSYSVIADAEIM